MGRRTGTRYVRDRERTFSGTLRNTIAVNDRYYARPYVPLASVNPLWQRGVAHFKGRVPVKLLSRGYPLYCNVTSTVIPNRVKFKKRQKYASYSEAKMTNSVNCTSNF